MQQYAETTSAVLVKKRPAHRIVHAAIIFGMQGKNAMMETLFPVMAARQPVLLNPGISAPSTTMRGNPGVHSMNGVTIANWTLVKSAKVPKLRAAWVVNGYRNKTTSIQFI